MKICQLRPYCTKVSSFGANDLQMQKEPNLTFSTLKNDL